jgi:hypothetical protein
MEVKYKKSDVRIIYNRDRSVTSICGAWVLARKYHDGRVHHISMAEVPPHIQREAIRLMNKVLPTPERK